MTYTNDSMDQFRQQLKQMQDNPTLRTYTSGYPQWDKLTGGLVRGGVTLIGGRPGMGRTTLALNIVSRLSKKTEGSILYFSPQTSNNEICANLMQIGMGISPRNFFDGAMTPRDMARLCEAFMLSQKCDIHAIDLTELTLSDLQGICCHFPGVELIVVDDPEAIKEPYFPWTPTPIPNPEPMANVIATLRTIAQELDVPVICTAHMHRSLESRRNKRPNLKDLQKIGLKECLVDQVVFLYRNRYYHFESDNTAECIIAKTFYGTTGAFLLEWDPDSRTFLEQKEE